MSSLNDAEARVKAGYAGSFPHEAPEFEAPYTPTAEDWADYGRNFGITPKSFEDWIAAQAANYRTHGTERADWLAAQLDMLAAMARRHMATTPDEYDARQEIADRDAYGR